MGQNIEDARKVEIDMLKRVFKWAGALPSPSLLPLSLSPPSLLPLSLPSFPLSPLLLPVSHCALLGTMFMTIGTAPVIATGLTFIFYGIYAKPNLSAIFTALNLLNMMRFVFFMLPSLFQGIAQILVRSPSPSLPSTSLSHSHG